jgi:DNA-binding NarL/FixJ family response regulator
VSTVRVLIADDHRLVRAGIRRLLESMPGVEVVAEADDGRAAIRLAREHMPDLAILDIAMPELNGLDACARIVRDLPGVRVLMLSMHAEDAYVFDAVHAGASGYVLKDAALVELELAVRSVSRGDKYFSPAVSAALVERLRNATAEGRAGDPLTLRQREILQLVAEGHSTRDIADRLHLSVKTIETHRAELMRRLGIHDVAGLTRYAIKIGLVRD